MDQIEYIFQTYMLLGVEILLPLLAITFVVAILVGVFQAVTQINEQTISFTPKLLVVFLIVLLCGGVMFDKIVRVIQETIRMAPNMF